MIALLFTCSLIFFACGEKGSKAVSNIERSPIINEETNGISTDDGGKNMSNIDEIKAQLEKQIKELDAEIKKLEQKNAESRAEYDALKEYADDLLDTLDKLKQSNIATETILGAKLKQIKELQAEIEELSGELSAALAILESDDSLKQLRDQYEKAIADQIDAYETAINKIKSDYAKIIGDLNDLIDELQNQDPQCNHPVNPVNPPANNVDIQTFIDAVLNQIGIERVTYANFEYQSFPDTYIFFDDFWFKYNYANATFAKFGAMDDKFNEIYALIDLVDIDPTITGEIIKNRLTITIEGGEIWEIYLKEVYE